MSKDKEFELYNLIRQGDNASLEAMLDRKDFDVNIKIGVHSLLTCSILNYSKKLESFIIKLILHPDIYINFQTSYGKTALHFAVQKNNQTIVDRLIKTFADADIKDKNGDTPLHYAFIKGNQTIINQLIEKSANVDLPNNNGDTPLRYAIMCSNEVAVEKLLEKRADINNENKSGCLIFVEAIIKKNKNIIKKLFEQKDLDFVNIKSFINTLTNILKRFEDSLMVKGIIAIHIEKFDFEGCDIPEEIETLLIEVRMEKLLCEGIKYYDANNDYYENNVVTHELPVKNSADNGNNIITFPETPVSGETKHSDDDAI